MPTPSVQKFCGLMTEYHTTEQLQTAVAALGAPHKLAELYSLSRFFNQCVFASDYRASTELTAIVKLTPAGKAALESASVEASIPLPDAMLALLGHFAHQSILIDWQETDAIALASLLNSELLADKIRYPMILGRVLYDRYFESSDGTEKDFLSNAEAWRLLDGVARGIFQHGYYVSGPFGLLRSQDVRLLPPMMSIPLWHCADTGCRKIHSVTIRPPEIPVVHAYGIFESYLQRHFSPGLPWHAVLSWLNRGIGDPPKRTYVDLAFVIGDRIVGKERTALLQTLLESSEAQFIRSSLQNTRFGGQSQRLAPKKLAEEMTAEEQVQAILLVEDNKLARRVDELIISGPIKIPFSEIRTARYSPPMLSEDTSAELSSFGIRQSVNDPIPRFCISVLNAYSDAGRTAELKWTLAADASQGAEPTVSDYVRRFGLKKSIDDLVLRHQCPGSGENGILAGWRY